MKLDFKHTQAAHCENGVTTSLLRHHGVSQITEPLAFGIGSGLILYLYSISENQQRTGDRFSHAARSDFQQNLQGSWYSGGEKKIQVERRSRKNIDAMSGCRSARRLPGRRLLSHLFS